MMMLGVDCDICESCVRAGRGPSGLEDNHARFAHDHHAEAGRKRPAIPEWGGLCEVR